MNPLHSLAAAAIGLAAAFVLLIQFSSSDVGEVPGWRALQPDQPQPSEPSRANPPAMPPGSSATTGPTGRTPNPSGPAPQGGFPRSFVIPGTNTSIRFGGSIDETLKYRPDR